MSYYHHFVPGFAQITAPLHALTKKNTFCYWTPECESAFSKLKELLTTAPVLFYPVIGPECEFVLKTVASGVGLGAVLTKNKRMAL